MKDKGDRYNKGKTKWSLVPFECLEPMVKVLEFGATKYAPYNWQKGLSVTEILESSLRHTFSFLAGEDVDPESGLSHLAHVQCNMLFADWMIKNKPEFDDRFNKKK